VIKVVDAAFLTEHGLFFGYMPMRMFDEANAKVQKARAEGIKDAIFEIDFHGGVLYASDILVRIVRVGYGNEPSSDI